MPADNLRAAVAGGMDRVKDDLAELAAFRSVADPKQCPRGRDMHRLLT